MKTSVELSQSVFDCLFALMEQGFYLQAYDFCQSVDLLSTQQDTATQILAGRLVGYLGHPDSELLYYFEPGDRILPIQTPCITTSVQGFGGRVP